MTVHIHTDGSCHGNPGPGGWAAIILTETGSNRTLRDGDRNTTNNRMELTAAIRGLQGLEDMTWAHEQGIVVHTDSKYVCNAFQQDWITNWQRNGWRNARKQPVANRDLWEQLIPLAEQRRVKWVWVKGHSGDHWNEIADRIANEEAEQATQGEIIPLEDDTCDDLGNGPEEAPGAYDHGWRDGYEAARKEFMEVIRSMGEKRP